MQASAVFHPRGSPCGRIAGGKRFFRCFFHGVPGKGIISLHGFR